MENEELHYKLSARIVALEDVIAELLEELNPKAREDHRELTIKALKLFGLDERQIALYLAGELML